MLKSMDASPLRYGLSKEVQLLWNSRIASEIVLFLIRFGLCFLPSVELVSSMNFYFDAGVQPMNYSEGILHLRRPCVGDRNGEFLDAGIHFEKHFENSVQIN